LPHTEHRAHAFRRPHSKLCQRLRRRHFPPHRREKELFSAIFESLASDVDRHIDVPAQQAAEFGGRLAFEANARGYLEATRANRLTC
jgi:hypothetical protein